MHSNSISESESDCKWLPNNNVWNEWVFVQGASLSKVQKEKI